MRNLSEKDMVAIVGILSFAFILMYDFVTTPTYSQPVYYNVGNSYSDSNSNSYSDSNNTSTQDNTTLYEVDNTNSVNEPQPEIQPISHNSSVEQTLININTADIMELTALTGIGEVIANKIVDYRLENGDFATIEEIMNVSGIAQGKFDVIQNFITV